MVEGNAVPGQHVYKKFKKASKIANDQKTLVIPVEYLLTAAAKFFSGGQARH